MGLRLSVFRWKLGDCTNGGLTKDADDITVVNADGPFEPSPDAPAFYAQAWYKGVKLVPARRTKDHQWVPDGDGTMFGGNYAATSDSRWGELTQRLAGTSNYGAAPIHDRREW